MINSVSNVAKPSKLISVKEAAARLECSESAVWQWIHQERLPRVKVRRATRLKEQSIDALVRLGVQPLEPTVGGVAIVRARPLVATEVQA